MDMKNYKRKTVGKPVKTVDRLMDACSNEKERQINARLKMNTRLNASKKVVVCPIAQRARQ